jgi:hypothetical protein
VWLRIKRKENTDTKNRFNRPYFIPEKLKYNIIEKNERPKDWGISQAP